MNLYKNYNQINLLKTKTRSLFIKNKRVVVFSLTLIFVMVISVFAQSQILNVKASLSPIIVGTESLSFGTVFAGESLTKQVYVKYDYRNYQNEDDAPENINYQIIEYPKPRNDTEREYCRANPTDYEKCYRDLCPFIEEISLELENDIVDSAQLTKNTDIRDNWDVILKVPGISGHLAQDHTFGFVDSVGEYGCDLSIEVDYKEELTTSICGYKFYDNNEDGIMNNDDYKLPDWTINLFKKQTGEVLVDTITVLANDEEATSSNIILSSNENYRIKADSSAFTNDNLEINSTKFYSTNHTYLINIAGNDSLFEFLYSADESGDLIVEIYKIVEDQPSSPDYRITDSNGDYCFDNVSEGDYILGEVLKDDWVATVPLDPAYYEFTISENENLIYNFGNYQLGNGGTDPVCGNGILESGEECDDGNTNNNDGCSSTCQTEGGGGGGGTSLAIRDEQVLCASPTSVVVTWRTDKYATSRVVYGTESQISAGSSPYYGYLSSTEKNINKVTVHSMIIENLDRSTLYYFKPISGASPDVLGKELMFNMADCCGTTVLGEEGTPNLTIDKTVNDDFANPGDTVKYKINITNNGNITAFNTILIDTLPDGFRFKDDKTSSKTWNLGNIENGQAKEVIYDVVIDNTVEEKIYTNLAQVSADNHNQISDSADLEIKKIRILGIELSPTGFSVKEFIILISVLIISLSSILILRKKYL